MTDSKPSFMSAAKLLALLAGILGAIGAWAIIPYRLELAEKAIVTNNALAWKAITEIREKRDIDHEILVRIDERLKRLDSTPATALRK
jgi:hypothetical protein